MTGPRHLAATVRTWWNGYVLIMHPAPGELILAVAETVWAVQLWLPGPAFVSRSPLAATTIGHEWALAFLLTILSAAAWLGLVRDPSRHPVYRVCISWWQMVWWTFAFAGATISRPQSPTAATLLVPMMLAYYLWRINRRHRVRTAVREELQLPTTGPRL